MIPCSLCLARSGLRVRRVLAALSHILSGHLPLAANDERQTDQAHLLGHILARHVQFHVESNHSAAHEQTVSPAQIALSVVIVLIVNRFRRFSTKLFDFWPLNEMICCVIANQQLLPSETYHTAVVQTHGPNHHEATTVLLCTGAIPDKSSLHGNGSTVDNETTPDLGASDQPAKSINGTKVVGGPVEVHSTHSSALSLQVIPAQSN